ncbi:MAG: trigger factor [Candidatus Cloacimonadota bacterium]|nr:MAG: trigger factor [Candidatus Cloacimonadota bacterium]PIE77830.1 MAG: trigger factor [Candidatus Delongbacteria bacterium]
MKTEVIKSKDYEKKISFTVSVDEMKEYYNKSLHNVKKNAKIDGFRKGKAPLELIEKMYKQSIEAESVDKAISDSYSNFLKENEIIPISQGRIDELKAEEGKDLEFVAYVEVHPEFDLGSYKGLEVEMLNVSVTDDELNKEVDRLRNDFATLKPVDTEIVEGSVAKIKMRLKGTENWEDRTIELGKNPAEKEVDDQILGLKKGDEKVLSLNFPENHPNKEFSGKNVEFEVKIESVEEKTLPDFNDEFVKNIDKKFESAEAFKSEIKENILKNKKRKAEGDMLGSLKEKINQNYSFEVPPTLLDNYVSNMIQNAKNQFGDMNIEDDVLKTVYQEGAVNTIRWQYVREAIIEAENLKVEKEDIDNHFKQMSEDTKIDIKKIKKYYAPRDKKNMLIQDLLETKLNDVLKNNNTIIMVDKLTVPETPEVEETPAEESETKE